MCFIFPLCGRGGKITICLYICIVIIPNTWPHERRLPNMYNTSIFVWHWTRLKHVVVMSSRQLYFYSCNSHFYTHIFKKFLILTSVYPTITIKNWGKYIMFLCTPALVVLFSASGNQHNVGECVLFAYEIVKHSYLLSGGCYFYSSVSPKFRTKKLSVICF